MKITMMFLPVAVLMLSLTVNTLASNQCYVSPHGNDQWSGRRATPNFSKTDGPFATIQHAVKIIEQMRSVSGKTEPVTISLRQGTYFLSDPLAFNPRDSQIHFQSYQDEKVLISGGKPLAGFIEETIDNRRMFTLKLPVSASTVGTFNQLFVNGERRLRPRIPHSGYYPIMGLPGVTKEQAWTEGQTCFQYREGDIQPWTNLQDVEIITLHYWVESHLPIQSVDSTNNIVELGKKSVFRLTTDQSLTNYGRYYVENVWEALDTPGQWYLHQKERKLYYYPKPGETIETLEVVAPVLEQLVRIEGTPQEKVSDITFKGIRFSHTQYVYPAGKSGSGQAAVEVPGAIYMTNAQNCSFIQCDIDRLGNYAFEIDAGVTDTDIRECGIHDLGAGGLKIKEGSAKTTVENCEIADGSIIFTCAVGILIMNSPGNIIRHNHIHDFDYTGVSVGWVWGYGESKAINNLIEFNHIHHIGRSVISDMGGIYTLGVSPGTVIRNNLIHDVYSYGYGGWGIYTDEGSTHILVENNIVYNTKTGSFHQHYGKENIVRNNIFAFSRQWQLQRTRPEEHQSFDFNHNIVIYKEGTLMEGDWHGGYTMDNNIYWQVDGKKPVFFKDLDLKQWQGKGQDRHSAIINPGFKDAVKHDFRLRSDSPALKMGFNHIDISHVGPLKKLKSWR